MLQVAAISHLRWVGIILTVAIVLGLLLVQLLRLRHAAFFEVREAPRLVFSRVSVWHRVHSGAELIGAHLWDLGYH